MIESALSRLLESDKRFRKTRRGYYVCGLDRSPELIAVARNRALSACVHQEFVIADLLAVTFTRLFDAILSRGVLNDLVEESARRHLSAIWRLVETRRNRDL